MEAEVEEEAVEEEAVASIEEEVEDVVEAVVVEEEIQMLPAPPSTGISCKVSIPTATWTSMTTLGTVSPKKLVMKLESSEHCKDNSAISTQL